MAICAFCKQEEGNPSCAFCKDKGTKTEQPAPKQTAPQEMKSDATVCAFCKQPEGNPSCPFCKDKASPGGKPAQDQDKVKDKDRTAAEDIKLATKTPVEEKLEKYGLKSKGLMPLAKKAEMTLKQKGLGDHVAAVALVMDVSGSMIPMFNNGTVQKVIERVMGLGLNFDDNGAIDIFAFQSIAYDLGEMTPDKFADAAKWILSKVRMGGTCYAPAIRKVLAHYGYGKSSPGLFRKKAPIQTSDKGKLPAEQPVYVLFVTDGDCTDRAQAEAAIRDASHFPVFFQFVGVGGHSFAFLDRLDNMGGRFIDNANFFEVRDPNRISEEELYQRMMGEYPDWLKLAKGKGLI